jgi:membrane-associated protease RseP (regulator of RpoE activity)
LRISSDPFEQVGVGTRKAALWTICTVLLLIVYGLAYPRQMKLVAMIGAFALLIMLHETGHFLTAKRAGMKVTEFFVGFGPRLWSFRRGETEYGVKVFPLGGYCRIIGMTNLEEVAPEEEERTYRSKPWHQRVLVAFAGPATNLMIAVVLMFTVLFFAGDYRHQRALTTLASAKQGAEQAGLRAGDQLIAINGTAVDSWSQVHELIAGTDAHPRKIGDSAHFVVRRGGQVLQYNVVLQASEDAEVKTPIAGITPEVSLPHPGVLTALSQAPRQTADVGIEAVRAMGHVFSPSGLVNQFRLLTDSKDADQNYRLISPVGYAQVSYQLVEEGWVAAFGFLIAINVFVALANLLPLFPLDGGHIAVASYEQIASTIRRRRVRVDVAKLMPVAVAVIGILLFMGAASVFLDITHPLNLPK